MSTVRIDVETGRRRRVLLFWSAVAWVVKTAAIAYWLLSVAWALSR